MKIFKFLIFIIIPFTLFFSCKSGETSQTIPDENEGDTTATAIKCNKKATVKDMTGLDGCGLMFELENGEKLMPENPENMPASLHDGQQVSISFTYLEDRVSACMAGKIVSIECLEELNREKE